MREYLEQLRLIINEIDLLEDERKRLIEKINLIPGVSYDGVNVQTSKTEAHVLEYINALVDIDKMLFEEIVRYQLERKKRVDMIRLIKHKKRRAVLIKKYMNGEPWWKIARDLSVTERRAYQICNEAIQQLEKEMQNEQTENHITL